MATFPEVHPLWYPLKTWFFSNRKPEKFWQWFLWDQDKLYCSWITMILMAVHVLHWTSSGRLQAGWHNSVGQWHCPKKLIQASGALAISQNHRITECSGLEGTSVGHLVQSPCRSRVTYSRLQIVPYGTMSTLLSLVHLLSLRRALHWHSNSLPGPGAGCFTMSLAPPFRGQAFPSAL